MSARAIAIHGNEKSGERRANLEIKSECPALEKVQGIYEKVQATYEKVQGMDEKVQAMDEKAQDTGDEV